MHFSVEGGEFRAVDGVSFTLEAGKTLGIVGESGCGKSVTALSIMGLVPRPPGKVAGGRILFEGRDLLELPPAQMRALRGDRISMIFQEPMSSLNPAFTIGDQIAEVLLQHKKFSRKKAKDRVIEMLALCRLARPFLCASMHRRRVIQIQFAYQFIQKPNFFSCRFKQSHTQFGEPDSERHTRQARARANINERFPFEPRRF